ncbi:UNVERIFIED_CONTAM: hypothetical protein Scaly_0682800 [Sesamum calycinum]|uniref:Uncharacterized protein n=1 Tax=Sesamum calycinum TaxID=2727403 RepID=A0AAW2R682_9LAMI
MIKQIDDVVIWEIKIGLITFYMLLTVKYPELKPHISELTQSIARELDVNASQVQLVNFTPRENDTLIKWAISPAESAGYISNATALNIISRLSENGIHLPESYGSYKVFEWKIEPPSESCSIGFWGMVYLAQPAIGAFVQAVDSVVAEQELQPLQN